MRRRRQRAGSRWRSLAAQSRRRGRAWCGARRDGCCSCPSAASAAARLVAKGRGRGKGATGGAWPRFEVRDEHVTLLGCLKWGEAGSVLSAHCLWRDPSGSDDDGPVHGLCRLDRTVKPSDGRPQQGRPVGFLVAWLWRSSAHPDRASHFADRLGGRISLAERQAARAWAESAPTMAFPLSVERPRRAGEEAEPERCP